MPDQQMPQKMTPQKAHHELEKAIEESNEVLIKATTPLQIFPLTLILDRSKIIVTKSRWFNATVVVSIPIEDVHNVTAHLGPIMGSVRIEEAMPSPDGAHNIGPFKSSDAARIASLAQGYVMALRRQVDLSALSVQELRQKLRELGEQPQ